jgi:hypothetical protein
MHHYMIGFNDNNNQKNIVTSNSITIPSDRSPLDIKSSVSQYRIEKPSGLQKKRNAQLEVLGLGNKDNMQSSLPINNHPIQT